MRIASKSAAVAYHLTHPAQSMQVACMLNNQPWEELLYLVSCRILSLTWYTAGFGGGRFWQACLGCSPLYSGISLCGVSLCGVVAADRHTTACPICPITVVTHCGRRLITFCEVCCAAGHTEFTAGPVHATLDGRYICVICFKRRWRQTGAPSSARASFPLQPLPVAALRLQWCTAG
jgi:hypothetical protein